MGELDPRLKAFLDSQENLPGGIEVSLQERDEGYFLLSHPNFTIDLFLNRFGNPVKRRDRGFVQSILRPPHTGVFLTSYENDLVVQLRCIDNYGAEEVPALDYVIENQAGGFEQYERNRAAKHPPLDYFGISLGYTPASTENPSNQLVWNGIDCYIGGVTTLWIYENSFLLTDRSGIEYEYDNDCRKRGLPERGSVRFGQAVKFRGGSTIQMDTEGESSSRHYVVTANIPARDINFRIEFPDMVDFLQIRQAVNQEGREWKDYLDSAPFRFRLTSST